MTVEEIKRHCSEQIDEYHNQAMLFYNHTLLRKYLDGKADALYSLLKWIEVNTNSVSDGDYR